MQNFISSQDAKCTCFPKGLEVQRLGERGVHKRVSNLQLFLLMDIEHWMKSLAEAGLGFDFFSPSQI